MVEVENLTGSLVNGAYEASEDMVNMQGEFLKILKSFFNLIFTPVLQNNNMDLEI